eukprot:COSAG02_NODE_4624_length_5152_cov_23.466653_2_plen_85_part_00
MADTTAGPQRDRPATISGKTGRYDAMCRSMRSSLIGCSTANNYFHSVRRSTLSFTDFNFLFSLHQHNECQCQCLFLTVTPLSRR